MHVSEEQPPRPPRPRPVEPFRLLDTPLEVPVPLRERPIETLADLGREMRLVRRELAGMKTALEPGPIEVEPESEAPPARPSRPARMAAGAWRGTQWLGVATLVLTLAAQAAALLKPGLVGPIQRALEALETLGK